MSAKVRVLHAGSRHGAGAAQQQTLRGGPSRAGASAQAPQSPLEVTPDAGHATLRVRPPDWIGDPQPQSRQEVGEVLGAILDRDHVHDVNTVVHLAYHDPVLRLAFHGDDDLPAIAEVTGLGEVVQRGGGALPEVEEREQPERLDEPPLGCARECAHVVGSRIEESHTLVDAASGTTHRSPIIEVNAKLAREVAQRGPVA